MLTVNPSKRATIVDICTDWWVNKGYEHSLLQVAEDMANLTPVRLDILLALAPVSPNSTKEQTNPLLKCISEQEKQIINKNDSEILEKGEIGSTKRVASTSFDQSTSKIHNRAPRKKKSKKSVDSNSQEIKLDNKEVNHLEDKKEDKEVENLERKQETDNDATKNLVIDNDAAKNLADDTNKNIKDESSENLEPEQIGEANNSLPQSKTEEKDELSKNITEVQQECFDNEKKSVIEKLENSKELQEIPKEVFEQAEESIMEVDNQEDKQLQSDLSEIVDETKNLIKVDDAKIEHVKIDDAKIENIKIDDVKIEHVKVDDLNNERKDEKIIDEKSEIPSISVNESPKKSKSINRKSDKRPSLNFLDRKRMFEDKKVDSNKSFERRSSVPVESFSSKKNVEKSDISPTKDINTLRSNSLVEPLMSPLQVQSIENEIQKLKQSHVEIEDKETTENIIDDMTSPSLIKKLSEEEQKKAKAKEILGKTIERARMNEEKRKLNTNSSVPKEKLINSQLPSIQIKIPKEQSDENILVETIETTKSDEKDDKINLELDKNKVESPVNLPVKPTPIARSYKKVTFTKDGACITETGKIYSAEGTDGTFTRIEKKSKVTHFPANESQSSCINTNESQSSCTNANFTSNLQKSDSQSSSGSTDIFDDIFDDHWSEDSIFPNFTRMKSLINEMIGEKPEKKSRRRSRAESCERNADWYNRYRRGNSNLTDHESDNDIDYDNQFKNVGSKGSLWQFLNPKSSIFERPSLLSRHFGKDFDRDFISEFDELKKRLNSDKVESSPQFSRENSQMKKDDSENKDDDMVKRSTSKENYIFKDNPKFYSRTWSKETSRSSTTSEKIISVDNEQGDDTDSPRKRIEQWLENDDFDDFRLKEPISMYATIGPRGFKNYFRQTSNRVLSDTHANPRESSSNIGKRSEKPLYEMSFTFNPNEDTKSTSAKIISNVGRQTSGESLDLQNQVVLPESSSLLDQLRTHGYRNIVTQRLTSPSRFTNPIDGDWKGFESLSDSDPKSNYRRGKSIFNSSSSFDRKQNAACRLKNKCMETNQGIAERTSDADASNKSKLFTTQLNAGFDNFNIEQSKNYQNELNLSHTVNQQNEPTDITSRVTTTYTASSTGDLPESNHPLESQKTSTNNSVTLKETLQERIHRKSFYSRFNHDRPFTSKQRGRSLFDSREQFDLGFNTRLSRFNSTSSSPSSRSSFSTDEHIFSSKSPSIGSDWFNRMEARTSQLMDDLLAANKQRTFFRDEKSNLRRRSTSLVRAPYTSQLCTKTESSYSSSRANSVDDENDNYDAFSSSTHNSKSFSNNNFSAPEVLRRAIDILTQKSLIDD